MYFKRLNQAKTKTAKSKKLPKGRSKTVGDRKFYTESQNCHSDSWKTFSLTMTCKFLYFLSISKNLMSKGKWNDTRCDTSALFKGVVHFFVFCLFPITCHWNNAKCTHICTKAELGGKMEEKQNSHWLYSVTFCHCTSLVYRQ